MTDDKVKIEIESLINACGTELLKRRIVRRILQVIEPIVMSWDSEQERRDPSKKLVELQAATQLSLALQTAHAAADMLENNTPGAGEDDEAWARVFQGR